jgi:hypothetical protein
MLALLAAPSSLDPTVIAPAAMSSGQVARLLW